MDRLIVLVEGQTEEDFVKELLGPCLAPHGFQNVQAKLLGNARQRYRRGGIPKWSSVRRETVRHLKEDKGIAVTTMVDYYGLPLGKDMCQDWPGRREAATLPLPERTRRIEDGMLESVRNEMGDSWNPNRFVPFVVLHEFEGLLFSDCQQFAVGMGKRSLARSLQMIRDQFESPEEINDTPRGHPSARILALAPDYQKPLFGNLAALEIGLETIREACPRFNRWIERLARLGR